MKECLSREGPGFILKSPTRKKKVLLGAVSGPSLFCVRSDTSDPQNPPGPVGGCRPERAADPPCRTRSRGWTPFWR